MEIFSRIQATENSRQYLLLRADILQSSGAPACLPRSMLMHLKSIIMLSQWGMGGRQGMGWEFGISVSVSVHYLFYQRSKHRLFVFPPKKTLMWRRYCSISQ